MGIVICPCGKEVQNWQKGILQIIQRDKNGKIIFTQCYHGKVIINKKENK